MSNLSELLPSGGGQNAVDFVASGTLGNGVTVALNSDGTVSAVAAFAASGGSVVDLTAAGGFNGNTVAVYDPVNNKVVISFTGGASLYYMTTVVGTVSGTSISFGTPVVTTTTFSYPCGCYHTQAGKIVYIFKVASGLVGRVVTVSGTTVSVGSAGTARSGSSGADFLYSAVTYDPDNQKVVVLWRDIASTNYATYASIGTVSGTSISFSSPQAVDTSGQNMGSGITYSAEKSVVLMSWVDDYRATVRAATSNGSTLTFGSAVELSTTNANSAPWPVYDSLSGKMLVMWRAYSGFIAYFQTVGVSGTTLTADSIVTQRSDTLPAKMEINSVTNKIYAVLTSAATPRDAFLYEITISGSTPTLDSGFEFITDSTPNPPYYITMAVDSGSNKIVVYYATASDYTKGVSRVLTPAGSTATDFIGITASAIADTATGTVNVYGGINEAQSGLVSGSAYYVQPNGSLSTTESNIKAGRAISATTINMVDLIL